MPKKTRPQSPKKEEMTIHNIKFPRLNKSFKPRWWSWPFSFFYSFCFLASITFLFYCILRLVASIIGK